MCDYDLRDELFSANFKLDKIIEICKDYKEQCKLPNACIDSRMCITCFLGGADELADEILDIIEE